MSVKRKGLIFSKGRLETLTDGVFAIIMTILDNGSNDYRAGNSHNSKCPPNDSLTWCAGYKVGYEVGWAAAAVLGN